MIPSIRLRDDLSSRLAWEVLTDGSVHAAFHTEADRARWLRKMGISMPAPHTESPESSNRWECPFCGERERFEGHDDKGFPGDECECEAQEEGGECTCEVTLSQPLTIIRDAQDNFEEVYYGSFVGGGSGAEIGSYHRIDCRACDRQIWAECVFCPSDEERAAGYGDGPCRRCNGTKTQQSLNATKIL